MNILYLAHRLPYPPDKGDKIRSYRQLTRLARRHQVWCASFVDRREDAVHVRRLRRFCVSAVAVPLVRGPALIRAAAGTIRGRTVTESFYRSREMAELVRRWSRLVPFDAVVAFSSSMAGYALQASARRRVLDLCDLDSQKWLEYAEHSEPPLSWLYRLEASRLSRRERAWLDAFDAAIVISDAEAAGLDGIPRPEKLHVITNGVDLPVHPRNHCGVPNEAPVIGFVGAMDYRPNVDAVSWFAEACWSELQAAHPEARFRIVGRSPGRAVRRLGSMPGVEVVGAVSDVQTELQSFDISVAPMRMARGLQNKVLEAMAAGLPVVLTTKAAEGINARTGEHFVVVDSADRMIRRILGLMADPAERQRIGLAARSYVARHHRWEDPLVRFEFVATGAVQREIPRAVVLRDTTRRASAEAPAPAESSAL
jgi:sugar transferase (PEP-CTERM/EpsH1 system associated)